MHFNPGQLARSHAWYSFALQYADMADKAVPEARKALEIARASGLAGTPVELEALSILAMLETDNGDSKTGRRHAEAALVLARKLFGDASSELSLAHNAMGTVEYADGRYAEAERDYRAASALAVRCLPPGDAFIVNQMASHAGTLYMIGQVEEALVEARRSANWALVNLPEDNPTITLALGNLGTLLHSVGRNAEAEVAMRKVVDLEGRYQAESWFYRAISLSNFASVVDALGRHEVAETLWLQSLDFHKKATIKRDPITPAYPLRFAADAAQARGQLQLALERRKQAVAILEAGTAPDNPERARAQLELALTTMLAGQPADALKLAIPALPAIRARLGERDIKRLTAEIGYARILAANGKTEEAWQLARPAAALLETRLLDTATSRTDLVRYGSALAASFAALTELALHTGRQDEAFRFLQLANLSDIVVTTSEVAARAAAANPDTSQKIRRFQDLLRQRQSLDRQRSFVMSSGDAAKIKAVAETIAANDAAIATAGAELDREAPAFRQLGRPAPIALETYRAGLAPEQVLLAPLLLDNATLAISVSRQGLKWAKSPLAKWQVTALAKRLRSSIDRARTGGRFDQAAARELYRSLISAAIEPEIKRHREIIYYASGPLASLPPTLLIAPGKSRGRIRWLIREHSVSVAASLAPATTARHAAAGPAQFLGVGAPDLANARPANGDAAELGQSALSDLPPLPDASRELRALGMTVGTSPVLLTGSKASKTRLREEMLTSYRVIAFATHGLVGGEVAGLSEPALVLTPGAEDDGLLTASEVMQLRLDADWVILSACNTASGEGAGGSSFGGLASAFIHAGARALLVSHWPVRDDIAARLSTRTLALHRTGFSRSEALRRATIELIDDPKVGAGNPALWAPFVLIKS